MSKQKIAVLQKTKLLELMASKPQLRSGKFSSTFTHRDAMKEWEEIAKSLNAIPGAKKEWKAWRKTWQDILSKTKIKKATLNKARRGTGGGPPPSDYLDEFEEGVAALLHPHSISGHVQSVESAVRFEEDATVSMSLPPVEELELQNPPLEIDDEILPPPVEYAGETLESQLPTQTKDNQKKKKVNLRTLLKEKVEIKKELLKEKKKFYSEYISIMERQARALEDISRVYSNTHNVNNNTD